MRKTVIPQSETLTYLLGDHLGSTSLAVDASDTDFSDLVETRYKPWGEVRFTTPGKTLPTRYTYTGQYSHVSDEATDLGGAGFGLLFYNARWYDPALGRFAQADTIVPGGVQGLDRYAYVNNSPINDTDPTGHKACMEYTSKGNCVVDPSWHRAGLGRYGITARDVSSGARIAIRNAIEDISYAIWGVTGYEDVTSPSDAFKGVYSGGVIFQQSDQSCTQVHGVECWGQTVKNNDGTSTITIYTDAIGEETQSPLYYNAFLIHEMGHAFDNAVHGALTTGYTERISLAGWTAMPTGDEGFATNAWPSLWIQGVHDDGVLEETADMFLGWVYNKWGADPRRGNWMALWMLSCINQRDHSGL